MIDVLVVGAGPAGSAAACWLASAGHAVVVVERRTFPRDKTCGDALTPRAVRQLQDLGIDVDGSGWQDQSGIRFAAGGRSVDVAWPSHPSLPASGRAIRRRTLDELVAHRSVELGAELREGHEAIAPVVERGFVRGAQVRDPEGRVSTVSARYLVVADGANSRFGRALGTFRTRTWPYATAIRSYWSSPRHDETWMESSLELRDLNGHAMPGYGWVLPLGDGTVNIGVGVLSTFRDFRNVNTTQLLETHAARIAEHWDIDPLHPESKPVSGRVPMGGSVGPAAGPTYLVIGDAAGAANPFNGDGISCAYETGRLAAKVLDEAIAGGGPTSLQRYPALVDAEYGEYFKVGRLFASAIGRPGVMQRLTGTAMHSRTLFEWLVRIGSNSLRDDEVHAAELAYRAAATIARVAPRA